MAIFDVSFALGLLLGIILACLCAWAVFAGKRRKLLADLNELHEINRKSQSEIGILNERALHASYLKDELNEARTLLEAKRNENGDMGARIASLTMEHEKSMEFYSRRVSDLMAVHEAMKEAFATVSKETLIKNADLLNSSFKQSMEHFFKISEQERSQSHEHLTNIMNPLRE